MKDWSVVSEMKGDESGLRKIISYKSAGHTAASDHHTCLLNRRVTGVVGSSREKSRGGDFEVESVAGNEQRKSMVLMLQ